MIGALPLRGSATGIGRRDPPVLIGSIVARPNADTFTRWQTHAKDDRGCLIY